MHHASSPLSYIAAQPPADAVMCYRPHRLKAAADWFRDICPATPFYAVKANPAPHILRDLWAAGITRFDVASEAEATLVNTHLPHAELAFLHPVKSRKAIARTYAEFGCRIFVLDTEAELEKILAETGQAEDLTLLVRVAVSNEGATVPLAGKFGASAQDAPGLLRAARKVAARLGVSFHVGSQAMNPTAWATAMADLSRVISAAGVTVDIVDVGGGFPGLYPGSVPPSLDHYAEIIARNFEPMMVVQNAELWCEPGRALVAEAESLLTRIDLIKGDALYINDGSFGALYDVVHERWQFPYRAISASGDLMTGKTQAFTIYGPTCDSADKFPDRLDLPAALSEGDYIEFGALGAYGRAMASHFNGFGYVETVCVADAPWPSLYASDAAGNALGTEISSTVI